MEYDIKLKHKPGRQMIVADALSRRSDHDNGKEDNEEVVGLPEELWIQLLDMGLQDTVAKAQLSDRHAQDVLSQLSDSMQPTSKWTLERGLNDSKTLFYTECMYIPDDIGLRRQIVSDHHDSPSAGHPGILATTRSVRLSYYWPGLQQFVRNYVNGCSQCQQFKINTRPTKPTLFPIPSGSHRLFGSIGIDFMTDLPLSEDGFDSIMVVVDHGLSKGVILIPTNKKGLTAEETAILFIKNVYSRFGLPDKTITDRGVQFDSELFREICRILGIKPALTTAFHPQANGGTERVNREIQLYLSIFCINYPSTWTNALKLAEFTYNNRPHADRNQTPFELMYGEAPKAMPEPFEHSEHPTVEARMTKLAQWRKDAIIAHEYARERMKNRITENYKPFDKGQLLWLEGRNLHLGYNKKITTKREGPFPVIERLGPINYRLKLPPGSKNHNMFNANLLTPYTETAVHGANFPHPPPDVINEKEEWEVERIIKHRGKKNLQYQVKWAGYEDITWEPESNLRNAQEALAEYWKKRSKPLTLGQK